jgi:hypothetical protein
MLKISVLGECLVSYAISVFKKSLLKQVVIENM